MAARLIMNPIELDNSTPIGWIGTGVMGASMCGHLLKRGYSVTVYTRTRSRAEALLSAGGAWADDPAGVAAACRVVCTMVGFPADVREVYFGERGVLSAVQPGSVLVDMTTTEPSLAVEIAAAAREREAFAVDAPVSGGDVGARNATLSIMVGGDAEAVAAVQPLFECLGKSIVHLGPAGAGQHAKMCNQIVIAGTMIGMCEALVYGHKAGLDLATMLSAIRGGAAGCWSLENYAPRILKGDLAPGFFVEHFIKDLGIALMEAERMRLLLPGLALAHQLYNAVAALGHGRSGTQALIVALETMGNTKLAAE